MVQTNAPPPLILLIGAGFLAGACALAYFSSPATLAATRTSPSSVEVVIEDRLFGAWVVATERFEGVRGARSVTPRPEGSTSRTSTARFLVLDTPSGQAFVGPSHRIFVDDVDEISGFIKDPARKSLVLKILDRGSELRRFLFAQTAVVFLALIGGFLAWLGVRGLFPDPNAGIGPR